MVSIRRKVTGEVENETLFQKFWNITLMFHLNITREKSECYPACWANITSCWISLAGAAGCVHFLRPNKEKDRVSLNYDGTEK